MDKEKAPHMPVTVFLPPLSDGKPRHGMLYLPADLTKEDVEILMRGVEAMYCDPEPAQPKPAGEGVSRNE